MMTTQLLEQLSQYGIHDPQEIVYNADCKA